MTITHSAARTGRLARPVIPIAIVTAVGGFLFGFDNGSISGSTGDLTQRFSLSPAALGWVTSSIIVGCIVGVLIAGRLSDAVGRRRVLLSTAVVFLIGTLGEAFAPSSSLLVAARIFVGIGIGTETTIAPLYIAEVAPAELRGRLVSFNQFFNTIGNLIIFTVSAIIANSTSQVFNVDTGWRIIFATGLVPAIVFVLLLRFIPESPRWLVRHGHHEQARAVLARIAPGSDPSAALEELRQAVSQEKGSGFRELWRPGLRKALVVGFGAALFQQITGINAIFYYAPDIFRSAGFGNGGATWSTVLFGIVLVLATLVSMWIIDRVGRRTLLIFGSVGMTVFLAAVGTVFRAAHPNGPLLVTLVLAFVAVFAVSFGTVAYVIIAEIFPTNVRGAAASVATLALWGGDYLVSQFFPVLTADISSSATFYLFAGIALLSLIFVLTMVPETKGRTLEEIEEAMHTR